MSFAGLGAIPVVFSERTARATPRAKRGSDRLEYFAFHGRHEFAFEGTSRGIRAGWGWTDSPLLALDLLAGGEGHSFGRGVLKPSFDPIDVGRSETRVLPGLSKRAGESASKAALLFSLRVKETREHVELVKGQELQRFAMFGERGIHSPEIDSRSPDVWLERSKQIASPG